MAAARDRRYLDKAVLCESHKSNGHSGDEDSSYGDEAADEDEQSQQADPWDLEDPHAQCCESRVGHRYLCLH